MRRFEMGLSINQRRMSFGVDFATTTTKPDVTRERAEIITRNSISAVAVIVAFVVVMLQVIGGNAQ